MYGSQKKEQNILLQLFQNKRSVFRLNDVAIMTGISNFQSLNQKLNYAVRTGKLLNPRKGIYAKPGYDPEEMACSVFSPAYISLGYVLQKTGVVFQYDPAITSVSYLSRSIEIDGKAYRYQKIKNDILLSEQGITRKDNINIATAERAFLDMLYLEKDPYFDNPDSLDKEKVAKLLPVYCSNSLMEKVKNIL